MKSSRFIDPLAQTSPSALQRTWGFRFSLTDALILAAFAVATVAVNRLDSSLSWLLAIVACHFFLFCNVFRVARRRELIWAALFIVNVGFWLLLGRLDWFNVLACQLPASTGVIAWETKAPSYHGVFANRLNPKLKASLEGPIQ